MSIFSTAADKARSFFADNKHLWIIIVIAVALFGGGLAVGRFALPPKTVVTEKIHETTKTDVKVVTQTETKIVYVHDAQTQQKIHRTIVEGINPPGCVSKTTTEDINVDSVIHDNTNSTQIQYVDRVVEKWQDRIVEKTTTTLSQPNWSLGAGVGYDFTSIAGIGQHGIPGMKGLVVQADLSRRVLGPLYMGVFLNTELVAGVGLHVAW